MNHRVLTEQVNILPSLTGKHEFSRPEKAATDLQITILFFSKL